ncbi:MAG TPA: hypothetical protein VL992_07955 [Tepidisphaeraceae bacterium]|nr:hypothetical protein [Tepidisphaeraceae bacterium]
MEDQFGNLETGDSSTIVTLGLKTSPDGVVFTPLTATDPGLTPGKSAKFFVTV